MTKVSKKKLALELKSESLELFLKKIKAIISVSNAEDFLNNLFTAAEKDIILRRLAVIILLRQGVRYREIENQLEISKATISRIKQIPSGYGYGRNLRKRKYSTIKYSAPKKEKSKKFLRPYKGAESII